MNTFSLKVIATDKVFYDGKCTALIIPALDGEREILAHHENMVIATKEGEVRCRTDESSDWKKAVVGVGFVHIANNRVTMLVDTAERPEDIDAVRAKQAYERAVEQLRQKQSIQEYHMSRASLARAMARLKEAGKYEIR
ncbi:MAG TPA: ATP synthase F1 subunit epsilon [Candidatus Copromonas avistercoris]|nr:ATP synthase F1 subunit epsilon [Candidatus Copromonas avistercoris]